MKRVSLWCAVLVCLWVAVPGMAADAAPELKVQASAESVGMSQARLDRIKDVWQREIDAKSFPGGVTLLVRDGKVVYYQTIGHMDAQQTKPMRADAIFGIASLTKPVVSVATMMLVEEGKMKLSDPVSKFLDEFKGVKLTVEETKVGPDGKVVSEIVPAKREPTIHDLLRHTAGWGSEGNSKPGVTKLYKEQGIGAGSTLPGSEMLKRLAQIPLSDQPGTVFRYGIATDVLGIVLERVTGKDLETLLKEMILHPLKMYETGFIVPEAKKDRIPEFFPTDANKDWCLGIMAANGSDGKTFYKGASGFFTTVADYYRFGLMLMNGGELDGVRLLSPKTIEMMTADHLHDTTTPNHTVTMEGPGYGFGLGFGVRLATGGCWFLGSTGDYNWAGAWGHYFFVDPQEKYMGIFMSYGSANRAHVRQVFKNIAYAAIVEPKK